MTTAATGVVVRAGASTLVCACATCFPSALAAKMATENAGTTIPSSEIRSAKLRPEELRFVFMLILHYAECPVLDIVTGLIVDRPDQPLLTQQRDYWSPNSVGAGRSRR